jgi:hypothetical protein
MVVSLATVVPACGVGCVTGSPQPDAVCDDTGGSATLSGGTLALSDAPRVTSGHSCLDAYGNCAAQPWFGVVTYMPTPGQAGQADDFSLYVYLPSGQVSGRYLLPQPSINVFMTSASGAKAPWDVASGFIDVTTSTTAALEATFSITLQDNSGQARTVTMAGNVNVSSCHVKETCSF